jgi:hypothetical protein
LASSWRERARRELIELRGQRAAWGYRPQRAPSVEPTVLATLGMVASGDAETAASDVLTARRAAEWLTTLVRADGSLPVSNISSSPGWATPYGLLLWSVLTGFQAPRLGACQWLTDTKGESVAHTGELDHIVGHDTTVIGWPWVAGTHSWVEPTALSILALSRDGFGRHPRVDAGIRLIHDRALESGGWNYGCKAVFGTELRPQPAPTGLALLALATRGDRPPAVDRALKDCRAAVSLGWGILGLRAHQAQPIGSENWLADAYARIAGKPDAVLGLALLLLASSERAPGLLSTPSLIVAQSLANTWSENNQ